MSAIAFKVTVQGDRELIGKLNAMPGNIRQKLERKITELALRLKRHVQEDKLQGQVLNHRTGRLQRSVMHQITSNKDEISAKVSTSADVPYAAIHEFGGVTRPHVIEPKKGMYLAFMAGGKMRFARRVNHPGSKMPERSYLRSSLADYAPMIEREIKQVVAEAVK